MGADRRLFEQLNKLGGSYTVIVGIGHPLKGDDAVGTFICQQLQHEKISADIIDAASAPENYIQPIIKKAPANLIIIDAVDFGAPPGSMNIFEPHRLASLIVSTHALSPHLFIDMITRSIKVEVCFIGIQPAQTQLGESLSAPVEQTAGKLISALERIFPPQK